MTLADWISRKRGYAIIIPALTIASIPAYFELRQNDTELEAGEPTSSRTILSQRKEGPTEVMGAYMSEHREIFYREATKIIRLAVSEVVFREYDKNNSNELDPEELDRFLKDNP